MPPFARLMLSAALPWVALPVTAQEQPAFSGRYIAAISDGDMRAYAYIDGELGPPRGPDELALIALPLEGRAPTAQIEVSNTVINPVYSIAASPDGDTIFVAETHTQREPGDTVIGDLEAGTPLTFVSFADGAFGEPVQLSFGALTPVPELPDEGLLPHHAEWPPEADIVAVTFALRNQLRFYRFYRFYRDELAAVYAIEPWGNPVVTTKWPMSGEFSRDGRHFVTNDLKWGPDLEGFYVNAPDSQLTAVRLADLDAPEPRHMVVDGAPLPRHAESIAFSNAGDLIATLNIGQTWIEPGAPGHSLSSLSLVAFDTTSGQMRHLGDWEMEGILPEGVAFDADDTHLVAGIFEYEGSEPRDSALEIWRVARRPGPDPRLVPTGFSISTGPGAHSLIVIND
ncbi:MAG: hypothetical protein AAGG47_16860 [Pseudomonadota bacterium]